MVNSALTIFIWIMIIYAFGMFFFPMLLIPNLGWKRKYRSEEIPPDVIRKIRHIAKAKTKRAVLEQALDLQFSKFYSQTAQVFPQCIIWCKSSFRWLWKKGGFIHCHQHDLVLRYLLLASGRFEEKDIKIRITHYLFNIHQHLLINMGENGVDDWIHVDPFAVGIGYPIGEVLSVKGKALYRNNPHKGTRKK